MLPEQKPSLDEGDDLFQPSLKRQASVYVEKPWPLHHQIWVAFFGGTLAITVLAYLNSQRLKMPAVMQRKILLIGLGGVLLTFLVAFGLAGMDLPDYWANNRGVRLAGRVVALLTFVVLRRLQESADRIYRAFHKRRYESLWQAGVVIVLVIGTIQGLIVYVITSLAH